MAKSFQALLLLLLVFRLALGVLANDEYDQISRDAAVCDEMHRISVQILNTSDATELDCQNLCTSYEECGFFTFSDHNYCRIYSACNFTWNHEDPSLTTEIYKRRWADLTLLSDSCTGNDCQVAVKCPDGHWPIHCEMKEGHGNGVFLDDHMCYAKGAPGGETHARINCTRNRKTFTAFNESIHPDQQIVAASCPSGSMPISCNCVASSAAAGCQGKSKFAPIGEMCALDISKFPESSGVKITAVCSYLATCQSHHCPSGYVLKSNAPEILCAGTMCNTVDDRDCCTPATCIMQRQLNDFSSIAAMSEAGWEFHVDGPTAFNNQLFKLQRCADAHSTNSYYGFDQDGDTSLSLKLTGRGVLSIDYVRCETDQPTRGALEVFLNGKLKFSSTWEASWCASRPTNAQGFGGCFAHNWGTHGSGPIRYTDMDMLQVKGIGRSTGIMIQRLQLMCAAPANLCQNMGGIDCSGELRSWAGRNTCVANVPTSGATCKEYCARRQLSCVKAMDNDGTKCGLYKEGHFRQTDERNGCLQRWADQICVCTHQPVRFELSLTKYQVAAEIMLKNDILGAYNYPDLLAFNPNRCLQTSGSWLQMDLRSQSYIDHINIQSHENSVQHGNHLVVKVDNDTCATVVHRHRNQVACRSIGKTLRIENTLGYLKFCSVSIRVIRPDAVWLDLSGMYASQSNPQEGYLTARNAIDGNPSSESQCTRVATSTWILKDPWWQINLEHEYDIVAVQVSGKTLHGFELLLYNRFRCAGPELMAPVDSKSVRCNGVASILRLRVNGTQYFTLCEVSIAVKSVSLPVIPLTSTSLEDLQLPCSVESNAVGLLAKFPLRSDINQSGISLDLYLKSMMEQSFEVSETSYTEEEIFFCVDKCRKRVACLRVVLTSGECLLYSHGVNVSSPTNSPMHQPSICWANHALCHEEDSLVCNPEIASTVIANSLTITAPLSKSGFALGSDPSIWQSGIAVAHQDVELAWVNIVSIDVASRRLQQQRKLGAPPKQDILLEYEIVVPPGSLVPTRAPGSKVFESAFKSKIELAGLDLQVLSVQGWAVIDRNPHAVVDDAPFDPQVDQGYIFVILLIILAVLGACIVMLITAICIHEHRKETTVLRKAAPILPTPVGRPSIEDEADYQELDAAIKNVLPSSWTHSHSHLSKSYEQMFLMNSDQYHVFRELLNSTHRPLCSQDRPCPLPPPSTCKRTRGGCPCVRPGGDPGLPVEYIVRRAIRVEDCSRWSRYMQKLDLLQNKRAGTGEIEPFDPPVFTDEVAGQYPDILEPLAADLNEVYLWHGTHVRAALAIAQNGFNMELAGSSGGNMYGNGIYMSESCTKADEYAKHAKDYYDEIFALVLCRVCLGRYYYTQNREPEAVSQVESGDFDSVCGDRAKKVNTFREMVVYDPDQVYPEYIILYSRRHQRDDEAELQRVAAVPFHTEFPIYWAKCCKDPSYEPFSVQYRVRRDTHDIIQQFVSAACSEAGIDDLTLLAARRIEDSHMWINYSRFKQSVNARLHEGSRLSQPNELNGDSQIGHIKTSTLLHSFDIGNCMALRNLDESVNEFFLWHGTEFSAAESISQFGFRIGQTKTHGDRFGKGTYLAEDIKKCLSYAPIDDTVDSVRVQYILLCRTVCGDIFYTEEDRNPLASEEAASQGKDCVLAHPSKHDPREFIMMDEKQVYPEFILELEAKSDAFVYML